MNVIDMSSEKNEFWEFKIYAFAFLEARAEFLKIKTDGSYSV